MKSTTPAALNAPLSHSTLTHAPLVARAELEILAAPEVVFAVLADIDAWPTWNPEVQAAALDGPLRPGTRFRWRSGHFAIVSWLEEVAPPRRIVWAGTSLGIRAVHAHLVSSRADHTVVVTTESWEGGLVRLFRGAMARRLQTALERGLLRLKAEAERRAQASLPKA